MKLKRVLIFIAITISMGLLMSSCYFNRPVCPAYAESAESEQIENEAT